MHPEAPALTYRVKPFGRSAPLSRPPDVAVVSDPAAGVAALRAAVAAGRVAVLTGAGISTESGIPDYRGPSGAPRRNHTPMTYQQFTGDPEFRRRYWARSHAGWRHIAAAPPNAGHRAVAALERAGLLAGIVTQNVDGLHQAGGARDVIELHGNLARVLCSDCGDVTARVELAARLAAANPTFRADVVDSGVSGAEEPATADEPVLADEPVPFGESVPDGRSDPDVRVNPDGRVNPGGRVNPDGDAVLAEAQISRFVMVGCLRCGGRLEPDVVFFGATVPRGRVDAAMDVVADSRLLLVLGSSLTVMSGYRFVLRAGQLGVPVAIVNQGPTRADARADLIVDAPLGEILPALAARLAPEA
ncbi:NAD-dependent deacetylase [Frankia sp. AgB1.9]|uniref:Sir2 family NAD-dependent protein deacetylase n=1 Tax=unclassified Frankia TaxID=2632575 RepID=UPI001932DB6D|nr:MULTISPECIES: Sir2 family NAD-dependent protein deacetylase [unclassified Frankia]MBL7548292.1 NAD-dependent deacetylase [Frankia sp. AgB1.9]MBL7618861.1 NAD-dependent deacetylase [Frankia sp. AgB1.8]